MHNICTTYCRRDFRVHCSLSRSSRILEDYTSTLLCAVYLSTLKCKNRKTITTYPPNICQEVLDLKSILTMFYEHGKIQLFQRTPTTSRLIQYCSIHYIHEHNVKFRILRTSWPFKNARLRYTGTNFIMRFIKINKVNIFRKILPKSKL